MSAGEWCGPTRGCCGRGYPSRSIINIHMKRITGFTFIAILIASFRLSRSRSNDQADQRVGPPGLEVHEWAVFVLDATSNKLNPDGMVQSTLPEFISTHRQTAPADAHNKPSPMGIIRLVGSADDKVDVKIEKSGGTFLGSWPKAQSRSNQLLWQDLTVSKEAGEAKVWRGAGADNWFNQLREADSAFCFHGEKFAGAISFV